MDIDFTYDPNKTIIEKMVEYHKKLTDDKFIRGLKSRVEIMREQR